MNLIMCDNKESEAETHLAVARPVPEAAQRKAEIEAAIEAIRAAGKRVGRITVAEILSARDEGRRF